MSTGLILTGAWQGLYTYPRMFQRVLFSATLVDLSGAITGSTEEVCDHDPYKGQTLSAILDGEREGNDLTFLKIYENGFPGFGRVRYEGIVTDESNEIEGRWSTSDTWAGKFLMIRATSKEQKVDRQVFERI